jgi:N-acetylglutamate synthase-like GNAT family acetyltransferase
MTMRVVVDNGPGRKARTASRRTLKSTRPEVSLRAATAADAAALHALIAAHLEEGRLLPRTLDELTVHAHRFVVATIARDGADQVVGCAELAPLSATVAEVRSLVVSAAARKLGAGVRMVEALNARARVEGDTRMCAFAHDPAFFVHRGFAIVPLTWVPEKIAHDCISCPLFRNCGQYAVVQEIVPAHAGTGIRTKVRTV